MALKPTAALKLVTRKEVLLGFFALISLILIFLPKSVFNHSFEFIPIDYGSALSDDSFSNGNSKVMWVNEKEKAWKCMMGDVIPRYCSHTITIQNAEGKGFDLSGFQKMTVWANYKGDASTIRMYLRNAHEAYYSVDDYISTKYNQIELPIAKLAEGLTIDMEDIGVADWWLVEKNIPLEHGHAEFNNVIYVEIQTGTHARSGEHQISLKKIRWTGTLVSNEMVYRGLVLAWSALILFLLSIKMLKLKVRLARERKKQQELSELNSLLKLQNKEFSEMAITDQLTGLFNRIGIRDALFENLRLWNEKRIAFSLILIDIDYFKQVNDNWGHDVGDEVLKATANLLRENTRKTDCLARWGGEEFVLICQDTDLYRAQIIAEILRAKIAETKVHPQVSVTASFGVASLSGPDLDKLFKSADLALYDAKKKGRNRVCVNADIQDLGQELNEKLISGPASE